MSNRFAGYRLISIFGILLILCVWLFVWRQCSFEYDKEIEAAYREEMNLARVYEDHVRKVFLEVDKDLLALRQAYQQEGILGPDFQSVLARVKNDSSRTQVGMTDERGVMNHLLLEESAHYDISDRDYFCALRDEAVDRMYVGKTIMGRQSHQMTIPLSRRITGPDGSFRGIFVIAVSPTYLMESFGAMELGPGKIISVTGLDGFTRIRQGADIRDQVIDIRSGGIYPNALQHPFGTVRAPNVSDDTMRLNAYRVLPEYSVYVNVAMADRDVLQEYVKRKNTYIGVAAVMTIFIAGFCGLLIRRNLKQQGLEKRLLILQDTTSRLVTDYGDTDGLLQTILQDALRLVGAPNGLIATLNLDGTEWIVRYGDGMQAKYIGDHHLVSEGLIGEVISSEELIYVPDYQGYTQRISDSSFRGVRSVICLPLKVGETVVGALTAEWDRIIPAPSEGMLDTLRQYGHLASISLERAETHAEIRQLAYTDTLTGLPNRRSLYYRLQEEMDRAQRGESQGAVFFVDLDNLKLINDTVGHSCGDILIVEASKHIADNAGKNAFVGRLAGDEFVVILSNPKDRQEIMDIADKFTKSFDFWCDCEGSTVRIAATAGIALFPENGTSVEEILKNADAALYAAKQNGKQTWQFYDQGIQQRMREKMLLANNLHHALERGELSLHYQPVMTNEGNLVGFEALLRWMSPEFGTVPPMQFIPIAEQNRLIQPIGAWVLQEACRFAKRLIDLGLGDLHVDVNVSVLQIEADDFCDIVAGAIKVAGIEPSQLGIEITESVFMESVEDNADKLIQLQKLGINVSLDDFGEGYSSLTKLLQLPVDTLKISRALISMLGSDQRQLSFVMSIVNMAHALGLTVVAEGVETEEQLTHVTNCRCDRTQGFFFYRPMPEEEALQIAVK
ncbi:MAG: EAL domain-containing protein [Negativicutes bacterium]|nr:EAL domain-containing protein [Negativicutes bacterium]